VLYSELLATHLQRLRRDESPAAVEILLEKAFAISRSQFWIRKNQPVRDAAALRRFKGYFARLAAGEPLAYILGEKEFFGAAFSVSPAVLIPRPETELLVEKALEILGGKPARVLDIGAGSGVIAITVARHGPARVTAVDSSRPALRICRKNVTRFGLQQSITVAASDLFPKKALPFDMIIANPPYLSDREWDELPPPIRLFEPRRALAAGPAGTEVLARIIAGAAAHLSAHGHLLLEIGYGQLRPVRALLKAAALRETEYRRDYNGIPRVVVACR
jgi:release factor glutamine methyltransferase